MLINSVISPDEARIIKRLMTYAARKGWVVSVHDGEEWVAVGEKPSAVMPYLGTTWQDLLQFRSGDTGEVLGRMALIYGNSGDEVIADHSNNPAMEAAWNFVSDGFTGE